MYLVGKALNKAVGCFEFAHASELDYAAAISL